MEFLLRVGVDRTDPDYPLHGTFLLTDDPLHMGSVEADCFRQPGSVVAFDRDTSLRVAFMTLLNWLERQGAPLAWKAA